MWCEKAEAVPTDHPCLSGHFPGNPIVPGTLILDRVISLLERRRPETRVKEVISAKFMRPLLPGQAFDVSGEQKSGLITFECLVDETVIATGKLALTEDGALP